MNRQTAVVLDTNLLVLLAVGRSNPNLIAKHKRLNGYNIDDYNLLTEFLGKAVGLVTCPNIATEASNLIRQIGSPHREQMTEALGDIIQTFGEQYVPSGDAVRNPLFKRLGLTDVTLLLLLDRETELLTVDLDVFVEALNAGLKATNFNHLREERLGY